jgi:hypothetical protein
MAFVIEDDDDHATAGLSGGAADPWNFSIEDDEPASAATRSNASASRSGAARKSDGGHSVSAGVASRVASRAAPAASKADKLLEKYRRARGKQAPVRPPVRTYDDESSADFDIDDQDGLDAHESVGPGKSATRMGAAVWKGGLASAAGVSSPSARGTAGASRYKAAKEVMLRSREPENKESMPATAAADLAAPASRAAPTSSIFSRVAFGVDSLLSSRATPVVEPPPNLRAALAFRSDGPPVDEVAEESAEAVHDERPAHHATPHAAHPTVSQQQHSLQGVGIAVGSKVDARYRRGEDWYPGTVVQRLPDGSYAVLYDDGDAEDGVTADCLRVTAPPVGAPLASSAPAQPAPAPHRVEFQAPPPPPPAWSAVHAAAAAAPSYLQAGYPGGHTHAAAQVPAPASQGQATPRYEDSFEEEEVAEEEALTGHSAAGASSGQQAQPLPFSLAAVAPRTAEAGASGDRVNPRSSDAPSSSAHLGGSSAAPHVDSGSTAAPRASGRAASSAPAMHSHPVEAAGAGTADETAGVMEYSADFDQTTNSVSLAKHAVSPVRSQARPPQPPAPRPSAAATAQVEPHHHRGAVPGAVHIGGLHAESHPPAGYLAHTYPPGAPAAATALPPPPHPGMAPRFDPYTGQPLHAPAGGGYGMAYDPSGAPTGYSDVYGSPYRPAAPGGYPFPMGPPLHAGAQGYSGWPAGPAWPALYSPGPPPFRFTGMGAALPFAAAPPIPPSSLRSVVSRAGAATTPAGSALIDAMARSWAALSRSPAAQNAYTAAGGIAPSHAAGVGSGGVAGGSEQREADAGAASGAARAASAGAGGAHSVSALLLGADGRLGSSSLPVPIPAHLAKHPAVMQALARYNAVMRDSDAVFQRQLSTLRETLLRCRTATAEPEAAAPGEPVPPLSAAPPGRTRFAHAAVGGDEVADNLFLFGAQAAPRSARDGQEAPLSEQYDALGGSVSQATSRRSSFAARPGEGSEGGESRAQSVHAPTALQNSSVGHSPLVYSLAETKAQLLQSRPAGLTLQEARQRLHQES